LFPTFFIAHGAPSLAIEKHGYTEFLSKLLSELPKPPRAIVIFSAHWENGVQQISAVPQYETIYDFGGFSEELYQITYPAKGDLPLSLDIQRLLQAEGIQCEMDDRRGLDHGSWAPLHIIAPGRDIPVIAMSVNPRLTAEEHYRIGKALDPLREQDVLILGSGGTVHNLRRLDWSDGEAQAWAKEFDEWLAEQLETWNLEAMNDYMERAPHARMAVPTPEHFVPLLLAMGAADSAKKAKLLYRGYQMGTLSLSCWRFG
jgi:4,5-DOPA dioxygenase extradiol